MTKFTRAPRRTGSVIAITSGVLTVVLTGLFAWSSFMMGLIGILCLSAGVLTGRGRLVSFGAIGLFACVVITGALGAPSLAVLIGAVATVVAWDSGQNAISLGQQLGQKSPARTIELVHTGATALVGAVAISAGYGIFLVARGGESSSAFFFLLLAAVFIASGIASQR